MKGVDTMYLDSYDHLVLNTAAKIISTEADVSLTKAKAMLFNAIDDPEFKKFVGLHLEEGRPTEVLLKNVKIMKKPKLN